MKDKGELGGRCNFTACETPNEPASWCNYGSRAYYCKACAEMLNRVNKHDAFEAFLCIKKPLPESSGQTKG